MVKEEVMRVGLCVLALSFGLAGCQTTQLPSNVQVSSNNIVEKVGYNSKLQNNQKMNFNKLKLCIAETIENEAVLLQDSANANVGAYTGTYYSNTKNQSVAGGSTFQYVDDNAQALIAKGRVKYRTDSLVPLTRFVKFSLKASIESDNLKLSFSNIQRAQQDTGYFNNSGFEDVMHQIGSNAEEVVNELDRVNQKIKSCIGAI